MTSTMQQLLDHHLAREGAEDGVEMLLHLTNGQVVPGALRKGPVPGTYQHRTLGQKMINGKPTQQLLPMDLFVTADAVHSFVIPAEPSPIIEPARIQIPGRPNGGF